MKHINRFQVYLSLSPLVRLSGAETNHNNAVIFTVEQEKPPLFEQIVAETMVIFPDVANALAGGSISGSISNLSLNTINNASGVPVGYVACANS